MHLRTISVLIGNHVNFSQQRPLASHLHHDRTTPKRRGNTSEFVGRNDSRLQIKPIWPNDGRSLQALPIEERSPGNSWSIQHKQRYPPPYQDLQGKKKDFFQWFCTNEPCRWVGGRKKRGFEPCWYREMATLGGHNFCSRLFNSF